jgi:hypothetical protein
VNASELEVDERFLYDRHRREPEGEQGSEPAPRERPSPAGRQRQPEASAPKRVIDPDNREDPSLDREHRRARVRSQAENRREDLGGLGGAVAAEELRRSRVFGQVPGRNKLKAGSRLLVSPFPEIKFILSCCGVL